MLRPLLPFVVALGFASFAHAEHAWPDRVVPFNEMKPLAPIQFNVPRSRPRGDVRGPVVMRVHVDRAGEVRYVALMESCGSPAHDEAALRAMHRARFVPKEVDGAPQEVTLVAPLHLRRLPKSTGQ